jgi:hemerythrin-like domain-containing protein
MKMNRRNLLAGIGGLSAGLILNGCSNTGRSSSAETLSLPSQDKKGNGGEVAATEDLMREHGVLRRALFVYSEAVIKLRSDTSVSVLDALHKTATLFRSFGEDYHEKKLEEAYIFPAVKSAGGYAGIYPDILVDQHRRGQEITDYILAMTKGAKSGSGSVGQLTLAMESLVRMYRPHAAREDTIVFPAWKRTLTAKQLDQMGEKFEEIERQQFGEDGFENAVKQIAAIESELGMVALSQFTAEPPPAK